jgi:hypothetical protein
MKPEVALVAKAGFSARNRKEPPRIQFRAGCSDLPPRLIVNAAFVERGRVGTTADMQLLKRVA